MILTAAGGGIQASGWTTMTLTKLHEGYGNRMTGGIGLISGVSGGSIGTLLYLPHYESLAFSELDEKREKTLLKHIHGMATRSSLESVGWGLLFPDLMRMVGIGWKEVDRGWAQEQVWAQRMKETPDGPSADDPSDWRLGHLAAKVRNGRLPAVVFNSYAIDSGQRVLIAPFLIDADGSARRGPSDYFELAACGEMRMRISTAARLSATFPYVTPTAIAETSQGEALKFRDLRSESGEGASWASTKSMIEKAHLGDGGYTDNEGLLTALTVVRQLRELYGRMPNDQRPFDEIMLIRIAPFPIAARATEQERSQSIEHRCEYSRIRTERINAQIALRTVDWTVSGTAIESSRA